MSINLETKKSLDKYNSYKEKINELTTKIKIVVNKLNTSYPNYKLYPNVTEIENIYTNDSYNLTDIINNLFSIEKSINTDNNKLLDMIRNKNTQLNELKKNRESLSKKHESMVDTDASSFGLHSQTKDSYQQSYISLVLIVIFTFIFITVAYKHINSQNQMIQYKPITKVIKNISNIKPTTKI